jgi:hypothetical protein
MDITALAAPFPPDAVSWRVGSTTADKSKGMALAYIDARDVQDRLTEVCGSFGWQCRHEVSHDKRITCHIGIRNPETGEWCWRSDGAGETDYEAEKGSYSDSFKRAAVKWGVGRYLYDLPSPWVEIEIKGKSAIIKESEKGRLASLLAKQAGLPQQSSPAPSKAQSREPFTRIQNGLREIERTGTIDDLKRYWTGQWPTVKAMPPDWLAELEKQKDAVKAALSKKVDAFGLEPVS